MPTDIISLTEFKNDASGWARRLQNQPPVVLTQNGKGVLVVQSLDAYQRTLDGLALAQINARATQDIERGHTIPHEQVMAEVYAFIDGRRVRIAAVVDRRRSLNEGLPLRLAQLAREEQA